MQEQIVTFSLMRFETFSNKWWAFAQMGQSKSLFQNVEGLTFHKMVGSGGGNGFSIFPNFGVYGLLCVWKKESDAIDFFANNPVFQDFKTKIAEFCNIFCKTTTAHGVWEGISPFTTTTTLEPNLPLAVLTRATIKWRYLPYFWFFVPRTSRSVYQQAGRMFTIGIGELPLVQQATFSIWENAKKMNDFAYKSKFHSEVVKKTRDLGWYREELFARFHLHRIEGNWNGTDLAALKML